MALSFKGDNLIVYDYHLVLICFDYHIVLRCSKNIQRYLSDLYIRIEQLDPAKGVGMR